MSQGSAEATFLLGTLRAAPMQRSPAPVRVDQNHEIKFRNGFAQFAVDWIRAGTPLSLDLSKSSSGMYLLITTNILLVIYLRSREIERDFLSTGSLIINTSRSYHRMEARGQQFRPGVPRG